MMMKWMLAGLIMAFGMGLSAEECDHNHRRTNNDLVPIGRFVLNPVTENDQFAFALIGEAGVRNFRVNGTLGTWVTERSRLKVSGEYLVQRLSWNFSSGKSTHWVQQGAGAAELQYLVDCGWFQAIDLNAFYSYSPNKHLARKECFNGGSVQRRLAGAQAYGGSVGGVILLSDTSHLDVSVNYDYVTYRRKYDSDKRVKGFGGSFVYTARLPCCVDFVLEAEFRRPFNYYGTKLLWPQAIGGNSTFGIFGGWTRGKSHLPNSVAAGIELVYTFGGNCCERVNSGSCPPVWDPCSLNTWVLRPAVYMPEVLAIADEVRAEVRSERAEPRLGDMYH